MTTGRIDPAKISATGKGESVPVTKPEDCKGARQTAALVTCLQPDRRVEIEVVSAHPAIEDWDAMMRALRQRIGTVAAARPATLSSAQWQDRLSDCALALAQLGCHLGRVDATPTAKRQRELELKQAGRLLASARHATVDGAGPAGPDPAAPAAPARTATRA
ncbi:MAG: hypothetical protein KAX42_00560 [Sphaerotilus sp.]|nr:hypothetical protein [Sphaerotilus sp.]